MWSLNEHVSTDPFKVRKNLWSNLLNPFTSSPKLASSDLSQKSGLTAKYTATPKVILKSVATGLRSHKA